MRISIWHSVTAITASILIVYSCTEKNNGQTARGLVLQQVKNNINTLADWCKDEWILLAQKETNKEKLLQSFFKGRKLYKKTEWALEYFFPVTAKNINGAPLPEIEPEEHTVIEPVGLQVIEQILFTTDSIPRQSLVRETRKLLSVINRAKDLWVGHQLRDDQVFDALRLELYRIITLGISGFDTPESLQSIAEIKPTLESVKDILSFYEKKSLKTEFERVNNQLISAVAFCESAKSFDDFERDRFITEFINPLSKQFLQLQKELNIPVLTGIGALNGNAATIFDDGIFDINFFTPDQNSWLGEKKVQLGKRLFYDPVLSVNNKISCATCHHPGKAFTDGLAQSVATGGVGFLKRNTPTLINAGYQQAQFYDMRATYLEDQVKDVVQNKDEIHGSLFAAAKKLSANKTYLTAFNEAFPFITDTVSEASIQIAIASYIRSLSGLNSRFDQYMRGEKTKLNKDELSGFNLFMGKAKCGTCHFMPLFNGTVPPAFVSTEAEVIGVPGDAASKVNDADEGRYSIYKIQEFNNAFKTPTVRNIALTAPYMHNGVFRTLEEVIEFYNKGGGKGVGLNYPNQTLPDKKLNLSDKEKSQLIVFLQTLTDTSAINK